MMVTLKWLMLLILRMIIMVTSTRAGVTCNEGIHLGPKNLGKKKSWSAVAGRVAQTHTWPVHCIVAFIIIMITIVIIIINIQL